MVGKELRFQFHLVLSLVVRMHLPEPPQKLMQPKERIVHQKDEELLCTTTKSANPDRLILKYSAK